RSLFENDSVRVLETSERELRVYSTRVKSGRGLGCLSDPARSSTRSPGARGPGRAFVSPSSREAAQIEGDDDADDRLAHQPRKRGLPDHRTGVRTPGAATRVGRRRAREPTAVSRAPPLAHTLDETLQDREAVAPDLRVAEVDADDGQQLLGRR